MLSALLRTAWVLFGLWFLVPGFTLAATISTIFNTGVDDSGVVLPDGTIGDPHYTLVSVPGGTSDILIITSTSGWPIPPYIEDNSFSRWIGPNNNPDLFGPDGDYTYRTEFDLTGFNPSTAKIVGAWTTDNSGLQILLSSNYSPIQRFLRIAAQFRRVDRG